MAARHKGPSAEECVIRDLIDVHARDRGDMDVILYEDGTRWTYSQLREEVTSVAAGLQQLGIQQYDHVLLWLPNGPEAVRALLAINYLGAICVPLAVSSLN